MIRKGKGKYRLQIIIMINDDHLMVTVRPVRNKPLLAVFTDHIHPVVLLVEHMDNL